MHDHEIEFAVMTINCKISFLFYFLLMRFLQIIALFQVMQREKKFRNHIWKSSKILCNLMNIFQKNFPRKIFYLSTSQKKTFAWSLCSKHNSKNFTDIHSGSIFPESFSEVRKILRPHFPMWHPVEGISSSNNDSTNHINFTSPVSIAVVYLFA